MQSSTIGQPDQTPSLDLVRDTTDRQVLACFFEAGEPTRPAIAQRTGISKPTISASIRRLAARGLVAEGGLSTGQVGRAGQRYRLGERFAALALHIGPGAAVAELVDVRGETVTRVSEPLGVSSVGSGEVSTAVRRVLASVREDHPGPMPIACSFAGPVTAAGAAVDMRLSPFLVGSLDLDALLREGTDRLAPLVIGNDVNWAALAELDAGGAGGPDSFLHVYLGEGLGGAVVAGGRLVSGHRGLGGEIAYLPSVGRHGQWTTLLGALDEAGLLVPGATTVRVDRLRAALRDDPAAAEGVHHAIAGALTAAVALLDPAEIVLGGPWADALDQELLQGLLDRFAAESVRIRRPLVVTDGPFAGARRRAVELAREGLLQRVTVIE